MPTVTNFLYPHSNLLIFGYFGSFMSFIFLMYPSVIVLLL